MKNLAISIAILLLPNTMVVGQTAKERSNTVLVDYSETADAETDALPRTDRKFRALIMGVSDYKYEGPKLQSLEHPKKDAQRVYDVLTKNYNFEPADVIMLQDPSRQQIIDAFESLSSQLSDRDNLLIFYAGHGYYDKQKDFGFWLPSDARADSRSEWIANSTIKDYIQAIKTKHTLLVTDACFGGSIFKTRAVDAQTFMKIHELYREKSRKAMTSGNLSEVPDQSVFIEQFVKKLAENQEDFLPAQKLFALMYEPVSNNSTSNPQFGVIQGAGDEGGDFIFVKRKQ